MEAEVLKWHCQAAENSTAVAGTGCTLAAAFPSVTFRRLVHQGINAKLCQFRLLHLLLEVCQVQDPFLILDIFFKNYYHHLCLLLYI